MRIPTGNFGQQVAAPQQAASVSAGAFNGEAGANLQRIGQTVSNLASDQVQVLKKAQTLRTMAETKNGLYTLADEINQGVEAGNIDPQGAEGAWQERSKKFMDERLADVSPEMRETVSANMLDTSFGLGTRVRDTAQKRTQANIGGELEALGVQLEREPDVGRAVSNYEQSVRALGPAAGWNPAQVERTVNTFREKRFATEAYTLVNGARNSMAALNQVENRLNSEEFAVLDPQRRATLLNTTAGYKTALEQRAVAQAQRAEIVAARRDREAAALYSQVEGLVTEGKKIDPAYIAAVAPKLANTPYAASFQSMVKLAPEGTAFAMQPLANQRAMLDNVVRDANASGWTPTRQARFDALTKSLEASERDYKADPLRAAVDRNVLPELAPLDMSGGVQSLIQGVGARVEQAKAVEVVAGRPVSPFTPEEAGQLATVINALPADQKATTMATLSKTLGARTLGAVAAQLDSKDRTLALTAAFGDKPLPGGGLVSERLQIGAQAIKDKIIKDGDLSLWRADAAKEVRGAYATPEMEDAIIDAAVLARAGAEVRREGRSIKSAIEAVSGGIIEFNGGRIPLPQGMTERQFEKSLVALPPTTFDSQAADGNVYVSGKAVPVADFTRQLPNAKLRHAGNGAYTVAAGAGMVLNAAGQPIIVRINNGAR